MPPTYHKGGTKNVYVEYYIHGHNCNINHEFSTMAFRPPTCQTIPPPMYNYYCAVLMIISFEVYEHRQINEFGG